MKTKDRWTFEYDTFYEWILITWWRVNAVVAANSTCYLHLLLELIKFLVMSCQTKSVSAKSDVFQKLVIMLLISKSQVTLELLTSLWDVPIWLIKVPIDTETIYLEQDGIFLYTYG